MEATNFEESNHALGPPPGMTEDEVFTLRVWKGQYDDGTPIVISCWRPTQAELDEINRTGRVWLEVMGNTMPPAMLRGINPFSKKT